MDMNPSRNITRAAEDMDEFDAPIPGQSFADTPGKWAWERPAQISDPEEAVDYAIGQIEQNKKSRNEFEKLLLAGIPIESMVNTISFAGFTEGKWTVDVAELIKLPLAIYLVDFAMKADIPATMFNESTQRKMTENSGLDPDQMFALMKENRPDMHEAVSAGLVEQMNEADVMLEEHEASKFSEDDNEDDVAFIDKEGV